MALQHFSFTVRSDPRAAVIESLDSKMEEYWLLSEGVPVGPKFPPTTAIAIAPDGGDMITDFIANIHKAIIVSTKARAIFEAELKPDEVEYLPFVLKDKKGKAVKEQFCICNALRKVDCFDWKRSVYKTYPNKPTKIAVNSIEKLHVREDQIPDDAKFFRIGELTKFVLIRSDLVDRLKAAGCTGMNLLLMGADFL